MLTLTLLAMSCTMHLTTIMSFMIEVTRHMIKLLTEIGDPPTVSHLTYHAPHQIHVVYDPGEQAHDTAPEAHTGFDFQLYLDAHFECTRKSCRRSLTLRRWELRLLHRPGFSCSRCSWCLTFGRSRCSVQLRVGSRGNTVPRSRRSLHLRVCTISEWVPTALSSPLAEAS